MQAEQLKGHLDLLLLTALASGAAHGYALIGRLRDRSDGDLDLAEGTVYPALHRLERAGLVRSDWDSHGGRRRRVYALTAPGQVALDERRQAWGRFRSTVDAVVGWTA
jgi:PadR family transcriptional regulator, regulatory protein PadR